VYSVGIFFRICLSLNNVPSHTCPLLTAFCLFTETFVGLVLLVLLVYVRRSLAYKYPPDVQLLFIKCLVVQSEASVAMIMIVCEVEQPPSVSCESCKSCSKWKKSCDRD
jgi:hypothetical protein